MSEIIKRLESYVNGDQSGMTQIYRDAISEIQTRDQAMFQLKLTGAELERKLSTTRDAMNFLIGHCNKAGLTAAINDLLVQQALTIELNKVQAEEFVFELFELVGKIIVDDTHYKCNIKSGLEHDTALFALKKPE